MKKSTNTRIARGLCTMAEANRSWQTCRAEAECAWRHKRTALVILRCAWHGKFMGKLLATGEWTKITLREAGVVTPEHRRKAA